MDKVLSCVERIRVIRGVNYGIITYEMIQDLFVLFDLNERQMENVYKCLKNEKIIPISEEDMPQKLRELKNSPSTTLVQKELDEQTKCEIRRVRFEKMLETYRREVNDNPNLAVKYEEELPIFIEAVNTLDNKVFRTANRKVVRACMVVSNYRVREARKYGWVCGTYMPRVRESFEHWVRMVFLEEELTKLLDCISKEEKLTSRQMNMIKVLLHNTPKTYVNRYISSFLDN